MAVNVVSGAVLCGSALYFNVPLEPVIIGSIAGTFVTPDYDLRSNLPKSMICKIPIIGNIWSFVWWPYHKLIKHRSFWSHSPVFSSLIRMSYLIIWLLIPLILLDYMLNIYVLSNLYISNDIYFLIGAWCFQDITHILLDKF